MILEFFKRLIANIISKPATTLPAIFGAIVIILAQGEVVVPPDMKNTVTVIVGIIEAVILFFTKKIGVSITEAKTTIAMRPSNDMNGGR